MLRPLVHAAAREATAVYAVLGSNPVAGRLGVVSAAVAGALFGGDAKGEEGAEEEGETHVDV